MAGRKSAASLSVVPISTKKDSRLAAPKILTKRQSELWIEIVNSKPADWFTADNASLLSGYVSAIASHEHLSGRVDSLEAGVFDSLLDMKDQDKLYAMQERQARLIQSFATKLRLTQQSRWQPKTAGEKSGKAATARPWD
jgi:hypothetical protein